jgi:hypothetical protein
MISDRISSERGIGVLFIESICTDEDLIKFNIALKQNSPDYQGLVPNLTALTLPPNTNPNPKP